MTDKTQTFEERLEKILLRCNIPGCDCNEKNISKKEAIKQLFLAEALAAKPEKMEEDGGDDSAYHNSALDQYEKNLRERLG